ncbi:MAG: MarR family transcriptional regulator [Bacillota bacterium]|jgi:DNA-binding MarR family transcriptional regulator|nr:MAG: MarR family transcriptional regulator [Bacillota bacterium]
MERINGQAHEEADKTLEEDVERIERLLRRISHVVYTKGRAILVDFGITSPQFDALLFLHRDGDMPMGALCDRMSLACSTVTDLVDRMEKGGFVARERDQSDRRIIKVRLLPRGEEMVGKVMTARIRYLTNILRELPATERAKAISALEVIYELIYEPTI